MSAVLLFAVTLQVAVLISDLVRRSVLSTTVLFLTVGFVAGGGVLGLVPGQPSDPLLAMIAELALFSVLFTDGMRAPMQEIASAWRLPGRALLLGLPLTMLGNTLLARFVVGLPWLPSVLVGAALSPTDPVFAAAIVGRPEIPQRLRSLLNLESGLNDGLALPVLLVALAMLGSRGADVATLTADLALGVGIGVALPVVIIRLQRTRFFSITTTYQPLNAFAIGLLIFASASLSHGNLFLAAFAGGIAVASMGQDVQESFRRFGELVTELLKLAAVFLFGALVSPALLLALPLSGYIFAVLVLVAVRPLAMAIALLGSRLSRREWAAAAWFGPKGFASVVYGLLILREAGAQGPNLFHLIAIVVTLSMVAHSSTDVLVARWFRGDRG